MNTEANNQEGAVQPQQDSGEQAAQAPQPETVTVPKGDYDKLNEQLGSLKRELKDLKKPKDPPAEAPPSPDNSLLQKTFLRAAGITEADEVQLAIDTAKKWGVDIDKLVDDQDFKDKLEKVRTTKTNAAATADVQGGAGEAQAKSKPEYWLAKGRPPSREEVPDRKARAAIARTFMKNAETSGKTFYND